MSSVPRAERTWLDVPFADKDAAKLAGARWDRPTRRWYAPAGLTVQLQPWAPAPDLPDLLPGEDRTFGGRLLYVDLVPTSCWFTNVRSCIAPADWDRLRRMVYARADNTCETCGSKPRRAAGEWLEAHERWEYDEVTSTQRLKRLIALCTACHTATHFGFAQVRGLEAAARAQLARVNRWTAQDVDLHIEGAVETWYARDRHHWVLDVSLLTDAGITVTPPPDPTQRARTAHSTAGRRRPGGH